VENWENVQASGIPAFLDGVAMPPPADVIKIVLKLFIFQLWRKSICNFSGLYATGAPN
jgi:hypothetical protein